MVDLTFRVDRKHNKSSSIELKKTLLKLCENETLKLVVDIKETVNVFTVNINGSCKDYKKCLNLCRKINEMDGVYYV